MLDVRDLHVGYGRVPVLSGVSLSVAEGEFVTLIGPNGAGKTTLLMALSGVIRPTAGSISFRGKRADNQPPHRIVALGLGHVAQGRELFPDMSVAENLELGAHSVRTQSDVEERMEQVLTFFPRLRERSAQRASTLSGGEQQMLAVARALMARPTLLALDEPSTGLAPVIIDVLADILLELNGKGLAILLVEQNAYLALELATRAYVLESGSITHEGRAADLMESELVRRAYLGV